MARRELNLSTADSVFSGLSYKERKVTGVNSLIQPLRARMCTRNSFQTDMQVPQAWLWLRNTLIRHAQRCLSVIIVERNMRYAIARIHRAQLLKITNHVS